MFCNSCEKLNYKVISKPCMNCGVNKPIHTISSLCEECSQLLLKCSSCLKSTKKFKNEKQFCNSCGKNI